jgi:beta-mannosidase
MHHCRSYLLLSLIIPFFLSSCMKKPAMKTVIGLSGNWQFRRADTGLWHPATVPGSVHTDLLNNGLIPDPFYGDNEKRVQWIEREDWEYQIAFDAGEALLSRQKVILDFKGLDTYADIILNDSLICKADNMFREWVVDCKRYLKAGENKLLIHFSSPVTHDERRAVSLPYRLPDDRAFTRKAPYQYGWDWGPRLITAGIWRPVYLKAWDDAVISDVHIIQDAVDDHRASMTLKVSIESAKALKAVLKARLNNEREPVSMTKVMLTPGMNTCTLDLFISEPRLWWPNGLGEPHLYNLTVDLSVHGHTCDTLSRRFGIRTVKLVQEDDSIGRSFYFKVNGLPVFMKGANYIPQDNFIPRVNAQRYLKLIGSVKEANMNMLRVWGGGIYENDLFYDLCDEQGILVWQDFMFACTMYPGDSAFLNNVSQEVTQNIIRLRNHPCLTLWCGNNEVDEGWHNWGWQRQLHYSPDDSAAVWHAYQDIFLKIIPEAVARYDGTRPYWPSSPQTGWGHPESLTAGDCHYWGVWWGKEPFETYEKKIGRFMSEYGFQALPDMRTIDSFAASQDRHLFSDVMLNHQKSTIGNAMIKMYMEREYNVPDNFESFVYVSQLLQADGIKRAIEAQRRAMPRCMGSLYWQLNDCWPVISWSGLDYYNRWKALHYFVTKAYAPLLLSPVVEEDTLRIFMISDHLQKNPGYLSLTVMNFNSDTLSHKEMEATIESDTCRCCFQAPLSQIIDRKMKNRIVLVARYLVHNLVKAENLLYFDKPMDLALEKPAIEIDTRQVTDGYELTLSSDRLAKNVYLTVNDPAEGSFSDNYFDLLPGEQKTIYYRSINEIQGFKEKLKVITLVDAE